MGAHTTSAGTGAVNGLARVTPPIAHWTGERWFFPLQRRLFRFAPNVGVPARWFAPDLPPESARAARTGRLELEVVSHCWHYAHLLVYQLSSLALYPPQKLGVRMTVFHCTEDTATTTLLEYFSRQKIPGVTWNWQPLPYEELMRRTIGRNRAALATTADWVWFTDCDLVFHENCLDTLADVLQGRREALVFPREERCTALLPPEDSAFAYDPRKPGVVPVDTSRFFARRPVNATGPLQIAHGDVVRAVGYCDSIRCFQAPARKWQKAYEDRLFRWVLGTGGNPVDLPGVYRVRHREKGRYTGSRWSTWLRTTIRRLQARMLDRRLRNR